MGHCVNSIQLQTEDSLMAQPLNINAVPSLPFLVLFCARENLSEVGTQCNLPPKPITTTTVATQCCLDLDFNNTTISMGSDTWKLQQCIESLTPAQEKRTLSEDKTLQTCSGAVETCLGGKFQQSSYKDFLVDNRHITHQNPSNIRMECHGNHIEHNLLEANNLDSFAACKQNSLEAISCENHKNRSHKAAYTSTTKSWNDPQPLNKRTVKNLCASLQGHSSSVTAALQNSHPARNMPSCSSSANSDVFSSDPTSLGVETVSLLTKLKKHCLLQDNSKCQQKSLLSPKKFCKKSQNVASVQSTVTQSSKLINVKNVSVQEKAINEKKNWYLKERFVQRNGKTLYRCFRCEEEFERKVDLTAHKQTEHKSKVAGLLYKCSECGNKFKSASKYHSHMGSHDNRFRCQICSKVFLRVILLKKHLHVVHDKCSAVVCLVCGTCFENQSDLDAHVDNKHPSEVGPLRAYSKECKHCLKEYVSENSFLKHVEHAPYKCETCLMTFSCNAKLKSHMYLKHKPQVCEYCGKSFDAFDNYRRHVKEFHSEKDVACPFCDKKFSVRSRMLVHVDVKHTPGLKYKCPECEYRAKNYASVSRHLRVKHRPRDQTHTHICPVCSKAFLVLSKLKVHLHTHAESKPFSCNSCGKGYTSKYRLTKHQKQTHRQAALDNYCHLCDLDLESFELFIGHMESVHKLDVKENSSVLQHNIPSHQSISSHGQDTHLSSLQFSSQPQHASPGHHITLYHSNTNSHSSLQLPTYTPSEDVRLPLSNCASSAVGNTGELEHQVSPLVLDRSVVSESVETVSACILANDVQNMVCVIPSPCIVEPSVQDCPPQQVAPLRNIIQCASTNIDQSIAPSPMPAYNR